MMSENLTFFKPNFLAQMSENLTVLNQIFVVFIDQFF